MTRKAARLLDIFHVGTNGSNVGVVGDGSTADALKYDPAFHVDPPTARTASASANSSNRAETSG